MSKTAIYIGLVLVIIAAIIFGIIYFSAPAVSPVVSPTTTATTNNISIANFAFSPNSATVNKGDTVVWTNNDSVSHHVVGDNPSDNLNGPVISPGQSFTFVFNTAGTFAYHCAIHPSMTGTIIVN